MSKNVYVFLAEGFEEIEAIGTIDLLRRAGLPTHIVAVGLEPNVTGAHGIAIHADLSISEVYSDDVLALVLPGGLPGVTNLDDSQRLHQLIREASWYHLHASLSRPLTAKQSAPLPHSEVGERFFL